jgi:23S rRNA A1618 N6-methylase RlmF
MGTAGFARTDDFPVFFFGCTLPILDEEEEEEEAPVVSTLITVYYLVLISHVGYHCCTSEGILSMSVSKRKRDNAVSASENDVSLEVLASPNFEELSRQPDFGRAYREVQQSQRDNGGPFEAHITQEFSIALSKALLHLHWGLSLPHLPDHHLCPPIPNRWFFVRWIHKELLPLFQTGHHFIRKPPLKRLGLDIGTGATAIYLLLTAAITRPSMWTLYGTEVDPEAVKLAQQNIQSNCLEARIHPFHVPPADCQENFSQGDRSDPVGPLRRALQHLPSLAFDFCMTNPPFYDDTVNSDRTERRKGDGRARTNMTVSEGSYPGGEVAFVHDMLMDGLVYFGRQQDPPEGGECIVPGWTCCMCGKKTSWEKLKKIAVQLLGPSHVCTTEYGPGHLTRWFLAWTFEQPQIQSPLAPVDNWNFVVNLPNVSLEGEAYDQVVSRIQEYCQSMTGWDLTISLSTNHEGYPTLTIVEAHPDTRWVDDSLLPERAQAILRELDMSRRMKLLPPEGHFLIQVSMQATQAQTVKCCMQAFHHSSHGRKMIEKTKSQLEGEICRTNRRWRRKLQREKGDVSHPMDET